MYLVHDTCYLSFINVRTVKDRIAGATLLNRGITNQYLSGKKFILLYKGTKDGFTEAAFASKCHNKGPTVAFVSSTSGYCFGGYNPESWKPTPSTNSNPGAFLFASGGYAGAAMKFPLAQGRQSATQSAGCLMVFGDNDIVIRAQQRNPNGSVSNHTSATFQFPRSYTDHSGYASSIFTGSHTTNHNIQDIEVFLVK